MIRRPPCPLCGGTGSLPPQDATGQFVLPDGRGLEVRQVCECRDGPFDEIFFGEEGEKDAI